MDFTLKDLDSIARQVGRMSVFYAHSYWSPGSDISLTHLGDTEGAIGFARNEEYNDLMTPEVTGPAKIKRLYRGEDPVVTIPIWFADSDLIATLSPTGSGSAGYERARPVTQRTLAMFPEQLFYDGTAYRALGFTGVPGSWTVGGAAFDTEQTRLMAFAMWFWNGHFTKPEISFQDEEGRRALGSVTFQCMRHPGMPDGHQLYTVGDPQASGINIEPTTA
jgi:hypothetical protein